VKPEHIETADPKALQLNGYAANPGRWSTAPTIAEVLPTVLEHLDACIMAGHNVYFDKGFLDAAHKRIHGAGLSFYHCFDTVTLAMEHLPGLDRFNLNACCDLLGISNEGAHTALADVLRCEALCWQLYCCSPFQRTKWQYLILERRGSNKT